MVQELAVGVRSMLSTSSPLISTRTFSIQAMTSSIDSLWIPLSANFFWVSGAFLADLTLFDGQLAPPPALTGSGAGQLPCSATSRLSPDLPVVIVQLVM